VVFNPTSSVVEWTSDGTISGGSLVGALTLAKSDSGTMPFGGEGLIMNPGDTMCVTAESNQKSDVTGVVFWDELF